MSTMKRQIKNLQQQILELQQELPDGSFQFELQKLQRELRAIADQPQAPAPVFSIVQPTPPPLRLHPNERAVFQTFENYHRALLQYSGDVNRGQWLHLVDVAADMTNAIYSSGDHNIVAEFNPPTQHGLWGWDGDLQNWSLVVRPPYQNSGILAYDAATGLWVPAPSNGGGGGSALPDPPSTGGPWAWHSGQQSWVQVATVPVSVPNGGTGATTQGGAVTNLGGPWAIVTNPMGGQNNYAPLAGNVTGALPAAGQIGQLISGSGSTTIDIGPGNAWTPWAIATMIVPPGDWDIHGNISYSVPALDASFCVGGTQFSTAVPPNPGNIGAGSWFAMQADWPAQDIVAPTFAYATTVQVTLYLTAWVVVPELPGGDDVGKPVSVTGWMQGRRMS